MKKLLLAASLLIAVVSLANESKHVTPFRFVVNSTKVLDEPSNWFCYVGGAPAAYYMWVGMMTAYYGSQGYGVDFDQLPSDNPNDHCWVAYPTP